jgi:hypothetical protein
MNQKILSELGDYLVAHREEIIAEWLRAVEEDPDIRSLGALRGARSDLFPVFSTAEQTAFNIGTVFLNMKPAVRAAPI